MSKVDVIWACLLAWALAGCVDPDAVSGEATVELSVRYNAARDDTFAMVNMSGPERPGTPVYESMGVARPHAFTALDVLEQWSQDAGVDIDYVPAPEGGIEARSIDGVAGTPENDHWWALDVDDLDRPACTTIDGHIVEDGGRVQIVRMPDEFRQRRGHC